MSVAVLSIGSNIGERHAHLRGVVVHAGERLLSASNVYQTAPWGGVAQELFLNAVLLLEDPAAQAADWLGFAQDCERDARRRRGVRWGPRTLDVDVITVYADTGPVVSDDPALTLPHPRAHERSFVLAPWLEVEPDAVLPQGSVADLLAALIASDAPDQAVQRTTRTLV